MKYVFLLFAAATMLLTVGCEKRNDFPDSDPALEHIYYVGFYKTNVFSDFLTYEVAANGTTRWKYGSTATNGTWVSLSETNAVAVPVQLHSERVRSYSAVTYFWVTNIGSSSLVAGTDYSITVEGAAPASGPNGGYGITWPETRKGIQNIKFTRLSNKAGSLRVNLYDASKGVPTNSDLLLTVNSTTSEYEVRCLTQDNDRVTVNFN
jgi:hypothetical protein